MGTLFHGENDYKVKWSFQMPSKSQGTRDPLLILFLAKHKDLF